MDAPPYWPVNAPLGLPLQGTDLDADVQMLVALGSVVRASSSLEYSLRSLFCSLEGSKYAAVTAAGQNAAWLLDRCDALIKCRVDVSAQHHAKLATILNKCRQAMQDRNRFVHDMWGLGSGLQPQLIRSHRKDYHLSSATVTLDALITTSRMLVTCAADLSEWSHEALGVGASGLESQLRWEDYLRSLSNDDFDAMVERRRKHFPQH